MINRFGYPINILGSRMPSNIRFLPQPNTESWLPRNCFGGKWLPASMGSRIFYFASSHDKPKLGQLGKGEKQKQGNTPHNNIPTTESMRFISRLIQYSKFLEGSEAEIPHNFIESKWISEIKSYCVEAGTTAQQISQGLQQIGSRLTFLLEQAKNLKESCSELQHIEMYQTRHEQLCEVLRKCNQHYPHRKFLYSTNSIQVTLFLLSLETQMNALVQLLEGSAQDDSYFKFPPDICDYDSYHNKFEYAWAKVRLISLDPKTKAKHDATYSLLRKLVIMVTSAVVTEHSPTHWNNQHWRKIVFGLSFPISLFNLQKAELRCYKLWRKPKLHKVKNLLDLPESGYLQHFKKFIFPKINSHYFLYTSSPESKSEKVLKELQKNIFEKTEGSNRILLLSHTNLIFKNYKPFQRYDFMKVFKQNFQPESKEFETVIIHIHGGGFISMSSELMQNYTRVWANQLKIPIFSLDYRKPPVHRFPEPLQDCVAGYKFIVEKIGKYMNIQPKNIILAGDSAGGNLACALTVQLLKQQYPILPKGLFLMYPAVDLRLKYSKSRLNSFSDGIFLPSLLVLCQRQYLGKDPRNQLNPLASPILLNQVFISNSKISTAHDEGWVGNWPKTVIMTGQKDPLLDDSIRLIERLAKNGSDCKMLLYKDFSHGFMSLEGILPGGKLAVRDSINELREMIKQF